MVSTAWKLQTVLSQELNKLPDKGKIGLLLKTMETNNMLESSDARCLISFCIGYLGSLLVMYGLNDWGG